MLALVFGAFTGVADPLGPGAGPWQVDPPTAHGLDGAKLRGAWGELSSRASLGRDCLVIIKDGALVFEAYAGADTPRGSGGFNASSVHQGYSMTKTLGALVAGWGTAAGRGFDIDAPLTQYGVRPKEGYAATPRQVMSQAVAGRKGPGETWAYDSEGNFWIDQVPAAFANATGAAPSAVWRDAFQAPLGLSPAFSWGGADTQWAYGSEGTCRDYARIGQLLLNGGAWPIVASSSSSSSRKEGLQSGAVQQQLVPAAFVRAMGTPATRYAPYPDYANTCYGLLTWLNPSQDPARYRGGCLVPGRSWVLPGSDPIANTSLWPTELPRDAFFAGGANGQLAFVLPELNAVVVSMGTSSDPLDHGNHDFSAACVARAVCKAFELGECKSP
jgi:CubicO group peptidase (beta-lactamase class C family)